METQEKILNFKNPERQDEPEQEEEKLIKDETNLSTLAALLSSEVDFEKNLEEIKILLRVVPATVLSALIVATFGPIMIATGKVFDQPLRNKITSWIQQHTWSIPTLKMIGAELDVRGLENISKDGQIIASNHQGLLDNLALSAALAKVNAGISFVFKKELESVPIFGAAIKSLGVPSIDRRKTDQAKEVLSDAGRTIKDNKLNVIWYPEGTRSLDGKIKTFKKGFAYMAIESGLPVVPVCVDGSFNCMPKGSYFPRPGEIRVEFGTPISTKGMSTGLKEDVNNLTALTEEQIRRMYYNRTK